MLNHVFNENVLLAKVRVPGKIDAEQVPMIGGHNCQMIHRLARDLSHGFPS
jgi:hypothetical protein